MQIKTIGRYEVKSELGRGGMATVYQAYDPRFERDVAIKVLPREMLHDPHLRIRFEREAKAVAILEHPSIVPIYDVGEEDGQPYFVMRCMSGGSLHERIQANSLSIADTARIIEQIASAIDEAHTRGVIHRDLKPSNILFDSSGQAYISDFGIAKIIQSSNATTITGETIIGTPAYMSPEQARGEKVSSHSDIYALGVIAFEMLTGRQPYESDTPMAVVIKHITDPVPHILDVNPNLPTEVERVIEQAMAKNRDNRFQTATEFARALGAAVRGETYIPVIPSAHKKSLDTDKTRAAARTPVRKLPVLAIGFGGIIIAGILAVIGFFAFNNAPASASDATATAQASPTPTETGMPLASAQTTDATATATSTPPPPTPTPSPEPTPLNIGGADMLAFVANNDIWALSIDGTNLRALTNDGAPKTDLQWLPDNENLVYISGKSIFLVEQETGRLDLLTTFPNALFLHAFRISPDGTQVAISLNREIFVVPFDLDAIRQAHTRQDLLDMKGCLSPVPQTQTAMSIREFRWSSDGKQIAWLYAGVVPGNKRTVDLVHVVDISSCRPEDLRPINEFPGAFFTPKGYHDTPAIPGYDWDGDFLFLLNTHIRNDGWGELWEYNLETRKAVSVNPIGGRCCYRDPLWSPDKRYVLFAFQDINQGYEARAQFYYVPYASLSTGTTHTPLPLPADFFKNNSEAPQPALRPVQP